MKKTQEKAKAIIMAKVKGLKQGKGLANFQNRLRTMTVALAQKDKLIKSDYAWAEKFIERGKKLKLKLTELGKQDVASFKRILDLYNSIKDLDLDKAKELAHAKMNNDLAKCDTEDQKTIVRDYFTHKTLREINLKVVLKNVLISEGLVAAKKLKKDKEATIEPREVVLPAENEGVTEAIQETVAPEIEAE